MKRIIAIAVCFCCLLKGNAQSFEAQQLLLDFEKLIQLKGILNDLYKGYEIVSEGYENIKNISEGNFSLHDVFLSGLLKVSPVVQKYKRVVEIIADQVRLVNEYKKAYNQFKQDKNFAPEEIVYLGKVYSNLFDESLKDLDALLMVITAGELRMSDDERLHAIDEVYQHLQDKLTFLRYFNNNTKILALQRAKDKNDASTISSVYGIGP